jgi:hypothetical protein
MADRRPLLIPVGLGCILSLACATQAPREPARSYDFFEAVRPESDPWFGKVEEWQGRARADGGLSPAPAPEPSEGRVLLSEKLEVFQSAERRQLARRVNAWAQFEAYEHYKAEANTSFDLDQWPTYKQLLETDGDDCDGLDLIAYELLRQFRYERVYRAIVRRNEDGVNHMVTLWFEEGDDPWVLDATGAMSIEMRKFSEVSGWTPTNMFNETEQYSVLERGKRPLALVAD